MEWILIGIAVAVGFYLAPIVIITAGALFLGVLVMLGAVVEKIFGGGVR